MADLISRAAAIQIAESYGCNNGSALGHHSGTADCIASEIAKLPAVDAVPVVHARWQGVSPFVDTEECSNCRYNIQSEELETPYCPWCGAQMDGERRDGE